MANQILIREKKQDPEVEGRIGCGGATLHVLFELERLYSHSLEQLKVLIIHAGLFLFFLNFLSIFLPFFLLLFITDVIFHFGYRWIQVTVTTLSPLFEK